MAIARLTLIPTETQVKKHLLDLWDLKRALRKARDDNPLGHRHAFRAIKGFAKCDAGSGRKVTFLRLFDRHLSHLLCCVPRIYSGTAFE